MIALDKINLILNGKNTLSFERDHPIVRLLVLENSSDYDHSIAPDKVTLVFDGYENTYELEGCPKCMNERAKFNG